MNRSHKIIRAITVTLAILVLLDILIFQVRGPGRIKGTDYLVLVGAVGILLGVVFAKDIATKLCLAVLMGAVTLLSVELILSVPAMRSDRPFAWYVWPPNYTCLLQPENLIGVSHEGRFTTNSRGIRGPEFSPSDRYRILCVGGSTTECLYLDDTKAWPAVLSEILGQSRSGVWVGNLGRSGHTVADHAVVLANLPEAQTVDCWLFLCGINDLGQLLRGAYTSPDDTALDRVFTYRRPGIWGTPVRRPLHRNLIVYNALEMLRNRAKVLFAGQDWTVYQDTKAKWVDQSRAQRQAGRKSATLPELGPLLDAYEISLRRVIQLGKQSGKRLIFATHPALWDKDLDPETERYLLGGRAEDDVYYDPGSLATAVDAFNERLKRVCADENVRCVDVAAAVPKSTDVFYDDSHFNEGGAQRIASIVADAILTSDWWLAMAPQDNQHQPAPVTQAGN